jgi:CelD/BcsL family acetyltransferase involved in cellulose biosynthesis
MDEMVAVEQDWVALEASLADGRYVFQTYHWCKIWADQFLGSGRELQLAIYAGWDGDELTFVCPLVVGRNGPFRVGYWMADPLTQYGAALIKNDDRQEERLACFWKELNKAQYMDAVWFKYIRHDSNLSPYLADEACQLKCEQAASLNLNDFSSWEDLDTWFNERHSRSSRRGRKQARRRLKGLGDVEMRHIEEPAALHRALVETLEFKAYWLEKGGLRSSTFANEGIIAVLRQLVEHKHSHSACRVYGAFVDGKAVAYDIGFVSFGRFLSHIGAFHPDYGQASPGTYLMEAIMADLASEEFKRFDLMSPAYDYKIKWASDLDDISDYALGLNMQGRLFVNGYLMRLRPMIKTVLDNMPLGMRRVVKALQDRLN